MTFSNGLSQCERGSSLSSHESSNSIPIVKSWERRRTIPELLTIRQMYGKVGSFGRRTGIPSSLMSYRCAWNPSRLQNTILSVGPGTPASVIMSSTVPSAASSPPFSSSSSSSSQSESAESEGEIGNSNLGEEESRMEEADQDSTQPQGRGRWTVRQQDNSDQESDSATHAQQMVESALMGWHDDESDPEADDSSAILSISRGKSPVPSIRHGGCINTAAWLDCGWRISTSEFSTEAKLSDECPTQLVTSGDDHLVKFWDVKDAIGSASPLSGGISTLCPFSAPEYLSQEETKKLWKDYYAKRKMTKMAGAVLPLATLQTGHHGNIFHVTPLRGKPGKIATCAADGYLKMCDLESGNSSVVVSPEYDDDLSPRTMCFSHQFLNEHTGFLCSGRGLRHFDLRLPPREQLTQSVVGGPYRNCTACAILSSPESVSSLEEGDSTYIFAGGSDATVRLCDIRMDDGTTEVVQSYSPSTLFPSDKVSVSGLSLSRDRQELLVSYESDQIYTFPVFPQFKTRAGPTLDDFRDLENRNKREERVRHVKDLAAYGGHLNRNTFLKNAKYAGPRDEYICTGSDSGHAWIYEKATGSVVSLLKTDHFICNGVIPHPTLPVFITYGIDSTAKLWRATNPVDPEVDDSPTGRLECYRTSKYEMSPTVQNWNKVQQECEETKALPDYIPSHKVIVDHRMSRRSNGLRRVLGFTRIGNDLHNLSGVLKYNLYVCIRTCFDGDDVPVQSSTDKLKHRISLMRLRHQADRLGLRWNPSIPWIMEQRQSEENKNEIDHFHPSDLVPDSPSDWIPYDPEMCKSPWDFKDYFNTKEYGDFYREHYSNFEDTQQALSTQVQTPESYITNDHEKVENTSTKGEKGCSYSMTNATTPSTSTVPSTSKMVTSSFEEEDDDDEAIKYFSSANNLLCETMLSLKDAGNAALQLNNFDLAARRYDKAIQYGAIASMTFPAGNLDFAKGRKDKLKESGGFLLEWNLIRVLIVSRLNLALLLLKPHFSRPNHAEGQVRHAMRELQPFCTHKGKIMKKGSGLGLTEVHRSDEPEETYLEAMALRAKGSFRLGSAHYKMGDYELATYSFKKSIESTKLAESQPDNLVLRCLSEAKRKNRRRSKRQKRSERDQMFLDFGIG